MTVKNREVIGYRQCPTCSDRGTVHAFQGTKKGYLFQRCGCGCDQRTGANAQTVFWLETEFLPGMKPETGPPNLIKSEAGPEIEAEKVDKIDLESDQQADLEGEVLTAKDTENKKSLKGPVLIGLAVASVVLYAVTGRSINVKI